MACWLDGKTVVVTGASGGMGAGIAATLIKKHGCTVIGIARSEPKMLKFIDELGPTYQVNFLTSSLMFLLKRIGRILLRNFRITTQRLIFLSITQAFFQSSRDLTDIHMTRLKRQ